MFVFYLIKVNVKNSRNFDPFKKHFSGGMLAWQNLRDPVVSFLSIHHWAQNFSDKPSLLVIKTYSNLTQCH